MPSNTPLQQTGRTWRSLTRAATGCGRQLSGRVVSRTVASVGAVTKAAGSAMLLTGLAACSSNAAVTGLRPGSAVVVTAATANRTQDLCARLDQVVVGKTSQPEVRALLGAPSQMSADGLSWRIPFAVTAECNSRVVGKVNRNVVALDITFDPQLLVTHVYRVWRLG